MTRQWNIDPKILCRKHLLGEHVEHHMLLGAFRKKKSVTGFIDKNQLEPKSLFKRHEDLAKEMINRNYSHNSALDFSIKDIEYLPISQQNKIIDTKQSLIELINRCQECKNNYEMNSLMEENNEIYFI
jgi:Pyrimidine dimer DNA glycosylase